MFFHRIEFRGSVVLRLHIYIYMYYIMSYVGICADINSLLNYHFSLTYINPSCIDTKPL